MKILYPTGEATKEETEEILRFSLEGRKRVKDQMIRIDHTFPPVHFGYKDNSSGKEFTVTTLEEREYPRHYYQNVGFENQTISEVKPQTTVETTSQKAVEGPVANFPEPKAKGLQEHQEIYEEGQKGVSYDVLFGPYLVGAAEILVTDPYIRAYFQIRNMMEFLETVTRFKAPEDEVHVKLLTCPDEFNSAQQQDNLDKLSDAMQAGGIDFSWEYDVTETIHARHIITDTGWKIDIDRGLDIFQKYDMNDGLAITNRMQEYRQCKRFQITFLKNKR
jgi:ATP-dependent Lon protease